MNVGVSLTQSLQITSWAEHEHDVCPECGDEYIDTDTTMSGAVIFIHSETDAGAIDAECEYAFENVPDDAYGGEIDG